MQVHDWMNNRPKRFKISASDGVIQLDLIARVHGVSSAEGFFLNLTNDLKDKRTYGALLNAYVHSRSKEKAESLLDIMRSKSYLFLIGVHLIQWPQCILRWNCLKKYKSA